MARKLNILHVDDSTAVILYTRILLLEVPTLNVVVPARTIDAARFILKEKAIDLVILDVNLPDGNGMDLLKWIKKNYPEKVVIMFTNSSDFFFKRTAYRAGADHFLDKSMEFEKLIEILKTIRIKRFSSHETNV